MMVMVIVLSSSLFCCILKSDCAQRIDVLIWGAVLGKQIHFEKLFRVVSQVGVRKHTKGTSTIGQFKAP